jgi:hypothetical protein
VKPNASRLGVGAVAIVAGFIGGCLFQHATAGYHFKVLSEKIYPSPMGAVHWSLVTESLGMPFLDTGTSIIKWNNRTIFKAQRDFQESTPVAGNIKTSDSTVEWDDGEFHYHLSVDKMPTSASKSN